MPDVDLSVFIASRVCRALQYVFERSAIVHRDVSPSNIMMTREGTVKLIDFGIATRSGTRDSSLTGKPAYMAPEMVVELRADNRSDLFSLGAVLFEMLTLQRLFQGETTAEVLEKVITGHQPALRSFNPEIPDGVVAIVRTALQRDPARRYASAGEMGAACEHYLYDKGYGPTNLSLKEYVSALFPEAAPMASVDAGLRFPRRRRDPPAHLRSPGRRRHPRPGCEPHPAGPPPRVHGRRVASAGRRCRTFDDGARHPPPGAAPAPDQDPHPPALTTRFAGPTSRIVRCFSPHRRTFAVAAVVSAALIAAATCAPRSGGKPLRRAGQRVFVLGFDGMDPTLARQYMDEGKLPNLKRLSETGTFAKLETTQPSESPVAWSSFATGVNPGKHNIYDFLIRDFETYMPDLAGVKREPPEFKWGLIPTKRPKVTSTRGGTSFWVHAGNDGVKSTILTVPMTFPTEAVHHGDLLGGLPLPDIRGTMGTFNYWATDISSFEEGNSEFGGFLEAPALRGRRGQHRAQGPAEPDPQAGGAGASREEGRGLPERRREPPPRGARHRQGREHPDQGHLDGGIGNGGHRDPGHAPRPEGRGVERLGARDLPLQLPGQGQGHASSSTSSGPTASCRSTPRR